MSVPNLIGPAELKSRQIPFTNQHRIKLEGKGLFPKRVMLGPKTIRYVEAEVNAWLAERLARNADGGLGNQREFQGVG